MSNSSVKSSREPSDEFLESDPARETKQIDAKPTPTPPPNESEFTSGPESTQADFNVTSNPNPALKKLVDARLMQASQANSQAQSHSAELLLSCPKCGADRVAKSRVVGKDIWRIRLMPSRPYRCLRCYNRFWHREAFMADKRRVRFWVLLLMTIASVVTWQLISPSQDPQTAPAATDLDEPSTTVIESATNARQKESSGSSRQLVKDMKFEPPRRAESEASELRNAGLSDTEIGLRLLTVKSPEVTSNAAISKDQTLDEPPPTTLARTAELETKLKQAKLNRAAELQKQQLRLAILKTIESWRQSWSSGDVERYLEFYDTQFKPQSGISMQLWETQRRTRVNPSRDISVAIADAQVAIDPTGESATVTFKQVYNASNYQEASRKELRLNKRLNQWYIELEREL